MHPPTEANSNVRQLLQSKNVDLQEVVRRVRASGRFDEITTLLNENELKPYALYVLSEIGRLPPSIWKAVLPFVSDEDVRSAYDALDVIQANALEGDVSEVQSALNLVNLEEEVLFAKACSILVSASEHLILNLLMRTIATNDGVNAIGLSMLLYLRDTEVIEHFLDAPKLALKMYASALVCRRFSDSETLRMRLPQMVLDDLALEVRVRGPS